MIHLENAKKALHERGEMLADKNIADLISVVDNEITFTIQDGPIAENGVNGIQVADMLKYVIELYKSLNDAFPCRENSLTITKLEEGLFWQNERTRERTQRQVEGYDKA
jgi:hypothetical protein